MNGCSETEPSLTLLSQSDRACVQIEKALIAAARAVVVKDIAAWTIAGGNRAKFIKRRQLREAA